MVEEVDVPADIQRQLLFEGIRKGQHDIKNAAVQVLNEEDRCVSAVSSTDSLDLLLERQRQRQLNHPLHQKHIGPRSGRMGEKLGLVRHTKVKETNKVSLEYDPVSKRKVLNTYEIINELGHGQHGKVKLAEELVTHQLVAIKIVDRHKKRTFRDGFVNRLKHPQSSMEDEKIKREIAIMKKCHHQHVVKLIEVLDDLQSRKIYLVLEYCSKGEVKWCPGDVAETKARGPPLMSFQRAREITRGVLLGLEYLHYQGIIHRDIKPANLLISENDTVKISDFGVSLAASTNIFDPLTDLELAKTAGTPAFFAPEICLAEDSASKFGIDPNSKVPIISFSIDIWALGVTLHCLLFGKLPFISDFELELFDKIVNAPLEFPSWNEVSACKVSKVESEQEYELAKDFLRKLLKKNPFERISIQDAKNHSWICWDFQQLSGLDDQLISSKMTEEIDFKRNMCEQSEQISISEHELDTAVGGIRHKLKDSLKKLISPHGNEKSNNFDRTNMHTTNGHIQSNDTTLSKEKDLSNSKSFTSNGNFILSEEPVHAPFITNRKLSSTPPYAHTRNEISAREVFQQELKRFDDSRNPDSIVSLPVNSSFASLDSFYIDNYAMHRVNESAPQMPSVQFTKPEAYDRQTLNSFLKSNSSGRVPTQSTFRTNSPSNPLQIDALTMGSGISTRNSRTSGYSPILPQNNSGPRASGNDFPAAQVANRLRMSSVGSRTEKFVNSPNQTATESQPRDYFAITNGSNLDSPQHGRLPPRSNTIFAGLNGSDDESVSTRLIQESSFSLGGDTDEDGSVVIEACDNEPLYFYDTSLSETESLPFEFGLDSEDGSVVSMKDIGNQANGADNLQEFLDSDQLQDGVNNQCFGRNRQNSHSISAIGHDFQSFDTLLMSAELEDNLTELDVPPEMLNEIPETDISYDRRLSNAGIHYEVNNALLPQISPPPMATTQESNVDHVVSSNLPIEARNFLKKVVLSPNKTGRTDSFTNIGLKNHEKNDNILATDSFINHYKSDTKDRRILKSSYLQPNGRDMAGRYRSKSVSVGLLSETDKKTRTNIEYNP